MREAEAVDHVGLGVVAHARVTTVPFGPPSTAIAPASMPDLIRRRLQGSCSVSPRGGLAYATPGRFPLRLVHHATGSPPGRSETNSDVSLEPSLFRPQIAQTMPHLRQCDAIATGRYMPIHL